ncbi:DEAD/DEAH box helicase [Photobacterium galatheae]|uniref:DEAD-box ATP-dependent RNA helicase RhpA n=1 Tax=Photobacterium galatheae TaxID=1654360 RepID=A0A066RQS5_9GAMM|nr:DEAD/DEAH box helicase [Photobacterium galatheae]KDM91486.1 DEAD/DEAH box helicase [Photobacterium galatheae]MCM0149559.1 DEAD/DEAH box helicase [Photobacterium galatheae]
MAFSGLGLQAEILSAITQQGFTEPTPVQQRAIPAVLAGKDVLAAAQTGTGKTAAYGLPLLQKMLEQPEISQGESHAAPVRALILTPTRELAQQVQDNLAAYADGLSLTSVAVYGGTSMSVQTKALKARPDIVVATPGRLLDHAHVGNLDLSQVCYLVFDEADRMLDMGFKEEIQRILKRMKAPRQTLLFSATFSKAVKDLAYRMMKEPEVIEVTPANTTAETVKQIVYPVDKHRKAELLAYLIGSRNWDQVLVFTKTKQGSDALVKELKLDGIKAASINGDKSQGARQRALDDFKSGQIRALIATDVAARGLDIEQLSYVVNFDLPFQAEDYVHRIGRTGRAGSEGLAVSLISLDEEWALKAIENLLDTRLPQEWLAGYEPDPSIAPPEHAPKGRSADKRRMKKQLKVHQGRGKRSTRR